jgi:cell division protein FtsB
MPVWVIVLLVILAVLLVAFIALMIFGNKLRKKQESQQAQIDAAKQVMSMLVIDKKKMQLPNPIKVLGTTEVPIRLHTKVTAKLKVIVKEA